MKGRGTVGGHVDAVFRRGLERRVVRRRRVRVVRTKQMIPYFSSSSTKRRAPSVPVFAGVTEKESVPNVKIVPLVDPHVDPTGPLNYDVPPDRVGKRCEENIAASATLM
jgi:hypothetical protein